MSPFRPAGTPDSMSSTPSGYSYLGSSNHHTSSGSSRFKIPDKLQIVKPLEGQCLVLHHSCLGFDELQISSKLGSTVVGL